MEWESIISLIVAIIALLYSIFSNTKKYELTYQYYSDILSWHNQVVETLSILKIDSENEENKKLYLSKLSALIESGRFYFPNIEKKDNFGSEKPLAYKGYRNVILDFLVYEYQLFEKEDCIKYIKHAETLQRLFTSCVFEYLEPNKQREKIRSNTSIASKKNVTINEFLSESPEAICSLFIIDDNEKNWETVPTKR